MGVYIYYTDNATRWVIGSLGEAGRDNRDKTETKPSPRSGQEQQQQQQQYTLSPGFAQRASATSPSHRPRARTHTHLSSENFPFGHPSPKLRYIGSQTHMRSGMHH